MKTFTISSDAIKTALKKLGLVVHEKTVLPVTKNIYVRVTTNEIELITTDVEMTISWKSPAETGKSEPFNVLIPFDYLQKIIAEADNQPLTIEITSVKKGKITCGRDVFELNSIDKIDNFPLKCEVPQQKIIAFEQDFVKLLSCAMLTAGKDENRPVLTRANLHFKDGKAKLASTDGSYLFVHEIDHEGTEKEESIQFSHKMAKAMEGMKLVNIAWDEKTVYLQSDNISIWSRRFEEKFPNYQSIIPAYETNLEVSKEELQKALRKSLISTIPTRQVNIYLKKQSNAVVFETDDPEMSRKIHSEIEGSYTGDVEMISLNAKRLLTMLDQIECEKLNLHIHFNNKAMLLSTKENEKYLGLIMPLLAN